MKASKVCCINIPVNRYDRHLDNSFYSNIDIKKALKKRGFSATGHFYQRMNMRHITIKDFISLLKFGQSYYFIAPDGIVCEKILYKNITAIIKNGNVLTIYIDKLLNIKSRLFNKKFDEGFAFSEN